MLNAVHNPSPPVLVFLENMKQVLIQIIKISFRSIHEREEGKKISLGRWASLWPGEW
jgi:hypothetical protein